MQAMNQILGNYNSKKSVQALASFVSEVQGSHQVFLNLWATDWITEN